MNREDGLRLLDEQAETIGTLSERVEVLTAMHAQLVVENARLRHGEVVRVVARPGGGWDAVTSVRWWCAGSSVGSAGFALAFPSVSSASFAVGVVWTTFMVLVVSETVRWRDRRSARASS